MTNSCWFCSRRINKLQSEKSTFCRWRTFLLLYYGQKLCNLKEGFFCLDVPIYEFLSSIKFKYTRWRNGYTSQTLSDKELSNIRGKQIKQMKSLCPRRTPSPPYMYTLVTCFTIAHMSNHTSLFTFKNQTNQNGLADNVKNINTPVTPNNPCLSARKSKTKFKARIRYSSYSFHCLWNN